MQFSEAAQRDAPRQAPEDSPAERKLMDAN
jgi:hypothetical protein